MDLVHSPAPRNKEGKAFDLAPILISDTEVGKLLACSRATIWRRVADGTLPKPVRLGGMTRFVFSEISEVVERAKRARSGDPEQPDDVQAA